MHLLCLRLGKLFCNLFGAFYWPCLLYGQGLLLLDRYSSLSDNLEHNSASPSELSPDDLCSSLHAESSAACDSLNLQ